MNKLMEFRYLLAFVPFILSFSCTGKKDVKILGFAYENDEIIVQKSDKEIFHFVVKGNADKNKLCSFYKMMHTSCNGEDIRLKIIIDSANIQLLDTLVVISMEKKEPFISLLYPFNQSPYKRTLFIADEADSSFLKY